MRYPVLTAPNENGDGIMGEQIGPGGNLSGGVSLGGRGRKGITLLEVDQNLGTVERKGDIKSRDRNMLVKGRTPVPQSKQGTSFPRNGRASKAGGKGIQGGVYRKKTCLDRVRTWTASRGTGNGWGEEGRERVQGLLMKCGQGNKRRLDSFDEAHRQSRN